MNISDKDKQTDSVDSTKHSTSVTSIKIFKDKYTQFKCLSCEDEFTLQKLVNRSIYLYLTDKSFRDKIKSTNDLQTSGSSF